MATSQQDVQKSEGNYIHANATDIYYVEAGQGEPLLLLHGGAVSTSLVWSDSPFSFVSHMDTLAEHFRVIAPDTRGTGRTINPGAGPISFAQLADDAVALIEALDLDRPMIGGFSEGAITATIVGIRNPGSVRAIVNDAGYDVFNPQAPSFVMMRQMMGGAPEATEPDLDAFEQASRSSEEMLNMLELMKADHEGAQGEGYLKIYLAQVFDRVARSPGYTFEDLRKIEAPTLILVGDRDPFCTVEEAVEAYRMLEQGELAILPDHGHLISPSAVRITIEFLERHLGGRSVAASH